MYHFYEENKTNWLCWYFERTLRLSAQSTELRVPLTSQRQIFTVLQGTEEAYEVRFWNFEFRNLFGIFFFTWKILLGLTKSLYRTYYHKKYPENFRGFFFQNHTSVPSSKNMCLKNCLCEVKVAQCLADWADNLQVLQSLKVW